MSTRREFLKTLAKIGAVAAVPAGVLQSLMPSPVVPLTAVASTGGTGGAGCLTLEMMQRAYDQLCVDRGEVESVFFLSKESYEELQKIAGEPMFPGQAQIYFQGVKVIMSPHMAPNTWAEIPRSSLKW